MPRPQLKVVAAVLRDAAGRVLIARRPPGRELAGWWEFPGGKLEAGESEQAALGRELREELGIEVEAARFFMSASHAYPSRDVELALWIIDRYRGTPRPLDGQELKWVAPGELAAEDILEADRPFVAALAHEAARVQCPATP